MQFLRDGQFDQIEQNQAGRLIAEGHAAKLLNMRSTLLTLAGGDPMPAAAILPRTLASLARAEVSQGSLRSMGSIKR